MKTCYAIILTLLAVFLSQCSSPSDLLDEGKYDETIDLSIRKIKGKKNKDPKYVQALEYAFEKANEADLAEANRLKKGADGATWEKIYDIHKGVEKRQNKIKPLLPIYDKKGYEAGFVMHPIEDELRESGAFTADFLRAKAIDLIAQSTTGDKALAREAFQDLLKLEEIDPDFKDNQTLFQQAKDLGTAHVILQIKNESQAIIPKDLMEDMSAISLGELRHDWIEYHTTDDGKPYDFRAQVRLLLVDVSPERTNSRQFVETANIEDGTEYVLDNNGNVAKDTLGNDITQPKFVDVSATITETTQSKLALIEGSIDLIEVSTQNLLKQDNIASENVFENISSRFQGDERALTNEGRKYLNNDFVPYPSDESMLYEAMEAMKIEIKNYLKQNQERFL